MLSSVPAACVGQQHIALSMPLFTFSFSITTLPYGYMRVNKQTNKHAYQNKVENGFILDEINV
jgi:hypothetical protein